MSSALSLAPTLNGFTYDSPRLGGGHGGDGHGGDQAVRDRLAPLLQDSVDGMERLALSSREPGFSLVTVSRDDRVVGYGAATPASVEAPLGDLPPVTVGGFTAEAAADWAAARGRGEVLIEPERPDTLEALRLDPFVIDLDLDTITTDQVARGLVTALLLGRTEPSRASAPSGSSGSSGSSQLSAPSGTSTAARRVLVRPASPAVAVLLRAGWRAIKMDPLSPWSQFEAPAA